MKKITLNDWKRGAAPKGNYVINGTVPPYVTTKAGERYDITRGLEKFLSRKRKEMIA
jgi:hypothetical protein